MVDLIFLLILKKQEFLALRLIFTQIAYAISMQKKGGHFILKVFDVFLQSTVELIFFLSSFYESVYIVKPHTSRYANSERYIVCKHFKYENIHELSNKLISVFIVLEKLDYTKYYIKSIINIPIPRLYLNQIIEINAILGQHQIENLINTMIIIEKGNQKNDYLKQLKIKNIQKCVHWCIKHNIPYYKDLQPKNMFLGN